MFPSDIVLDIGAHIGISAIEAARTVQKVVAIELLHWTYRILCSNVARAGLEDRIECVEGAVAHDAMDLELLCLHCGKVGADRLFLCSTSKA